MYNQSQNGRSEREEQRTYEKTQTHEEVLPTEVAVGHVAIGSEACVSWDNYEASNRGKYRSKGEEDGECCYQVFFIVR